MLTTECNAACRHCGFSCSPRMGKSIDVKEAKALLLDARRYPSLQCVCITGGEPFLRYEELDGLVHFASNLGIWSEVVTNSYWASSYEVAAERLEVLQRNGMRNFVTSFDSFHAEFVEIERVRNAVRAAIDLNMRVTIKIQRSQDEWFNAKTARNYFSIQTNERNVKIYEEVAIRAGRADARLLETLPESVNSFAGRCEKVIRFPVVRPSGAVYPCCGFGELPRYSGSTKRYPFSTIFANIQRNLLLNMIAELGPARVYEMAKALAPCLPSKRYFSACDVCNDLYCNEAVHGAVERLLCSLLSRLNENRPSC